jgi:UDP-2-acetamido-3-amino-2,3-dideoxy-glucuronate N-acetyltransferase
MLRSEESDNITAQAFVHPTATVEEGAVVGAGSKIWHQSHVRAGSRIGGSCTIGFSVYVDRGVVIGDGCKIQNHVSLYQGVILEDEVFVGPAVSFTNDLYPRAASMEWQVVPTHVRRGASLGANVTVVCGVDIGVWSMVGAGSVVAADVPSHGLMIGVPARLRGWVCICGGLLARLGDELPPTCKKCGRSSNQLVIQ